MKYIIKVIKCLWLFIISILWAITIIITIAIWYITIESIKESSKETEELEYRIKNIEEIFWLTWKNEEYTYGSDVKNFYYPKNNKTLKLIWRQDDFVIADWKTIGWIDDQWTWNKIKLNNNDWSYELSMVNRDNQIIYSLILYNDDPDYRDIFTYLNNKKVWNATFNAEYYKKYVQQSWEKLVWPNWAYYIWEFNKDLKRNWKWIMYYFWTNVSKSIKVTDNLVLDIWEGCDYLEAWTIYSWEWKDDKENWEWETYRYTRWWNRVEVSKWIFSWWKAIKYDKIIYQKNNTHWEDVFWDWNKYTIIQKYHYDKEEWIEEREWKTMEWVPFKQISDKNVNNWTPIIYFENKEKTITTEHKTMREIIQELDQIKPELKGWELYYDNIAIYSWEMVNIDWKYIKQWTWILKINNRCDDTYLSWNWWNYNIESWRIDTYFNWNWELSINCWPYKYKIKWNINYWFYWTEDINTWYKEYYDKFNWEYYETTNSYYSWDTNHHTFIWNWIRKDMDLEYYSWNRNYWWNYDWYWIYRLYSEIKTWWNFAENEENYEIIYELSGYWNNWSYIWKQQWEINKIRFF